MRVTKKLFGSALCCFRRISRTPQLKTAIHAVDVGETLADQVGRRVLAGIAVITDHDRRCIKIGGADEIRDGDVVQLLRAGDMQRGICCRISNIDHHRALFAQGLGLFWGDAFEFANGGLLWLG